jgi:glycosyltransferase involved in cell wall biosynthesis
MRVVVLNDYGHVNGGASQVAISSLNPLADAGLEVIFVSSVGPVAHTINREKVKTVNFGFHDLLNNPSRFEASIRGIWDPRCADRLRAILANCNTVDTIVHLHGWMKSLSSSVAQVATSLGFKVVCTLHDYFAVCPNGGLYNFPEERACDFQPMSLDCITSNCDARSYSQKLWRIGRQAIQQSLGGIPGKLIYFITVSDYSQSLLRPLLPSTAEFFQVKNPIEIDRLAPTTVSDNRAFTFIGRLSPEKGPATFAAAAKLASVNAVFVGAGSEEQRIASINGSAKLLGWRDRHGVVQAIRESRAIIFPSRWHETQGMVVLEAAALGVPAIVSDSCAARDAIIDGETGLVFRSGDASDLASKLELLDRTPELAAIMGKRAYENYWKSPSTLALHTGQLIACYQEILGRDK